MIGFGLTVNLAFLDFSLSYIYVIVLFIELIYDSISKSFDLEFKELDVFKSIPSDVDALAAREEIFNSIEVLVYFSSVPDL